MSYLAVLTGSRAVVPPPTMDAVNPLVDDLIEAGMSFTGRTRTAGDAVVLRASGDIEWLDKKLVAATVARVEARHPLRVDVKHAAGSGDLVVSVRRA